ncbi:GNAT family N-acetyltransferase [Pseudoalteromonas rubra]|uniref:N-acetyltransferase n=1 Tax=Pseudoalteromonas rubra TaxID=43658 RepID=A0A5S3WV92_9GAMM|nr:GNAT family N-acetyltransferase [Pseudoalteromonas rubra]TMP33361.1 N-acetyltransferase [Pseudoalteromonas rubra]
MDITAGVLPAIQTPLVNKFYQAHRARGRATRHDQNWVLKSTEIVAACRIQCVAGSDFLSTVLVDPKLRGKGFARQLLKAVLTQQHTPLYTFAYRHLATFYAKLGFEVIPPEGLPLALADKYHNYVAQGRQILAMQRITLNQN